MDTDALVQLSADDEAHTPPTKYPRHYYLLSDAELKSLGLRRYQRKIMPLAKTVRLPKKKPEPPKETIVLESGELIPSLETLLTPARKERDFLDIAGFQEKQLEACRAALSHKYLLYGGAAGGGKSYFLRWMAVLLLMSYYEKYGIKGVTVGLFCEDYPALKGRQISKVEFEFPSWLGTMNKSDSEFRLAPEYGGGIIAFRNLDDPTKYLSYEFASILVDEITRDPQEVFHFLVMRMRWPGIDTADTKFVCASNPGGPGHGWVKGLWIDRDFRDFNKIDPSEVVYVKALYTDNKYIDAGYGDQLSMLPDDLARAYRDGDWDIFAGQFFTEFHRDIHVIEPMTDPDTLALFNSLPIYVGLDYGYRAPSAVVFGRYWDGDWYIFDEIYVKEHTYEALRDLITAKGYDCEIIFADPSIWAKKDSPTSGADKMQPLTVRQAMNAREIGWTILREYFKTKRIKIYNTCTHLIRTIPVQVHHEKHVEDLDTNGEDHAVDALRYLIVSHKHMVEQKDVLTYIPGYQQSGSDIEELFGTGENHPTLYSMGFIRPQT